MEQRRLEAGSVPQQQRDMDLQDEGPGRYRKVGEDSGDERGKRERCVLSMIALEPGKRAGLAPGDQSFAQRRNGQRCHRVGGGWYQWSPSTDGRNQGDEV